MDIKKGYDLIVIGGGPGGYVGAIRASQLGADVLLVEKDELGGTCLNCGCIPTKTILSDAKLFDHLRRSEVVKADNIRIDMNKLIDRKNKVIKTLNSGIKFLIKDNGISFINGKASFIDRRTIEVKSREGIKRFEGDKIIIATGSVSASIPNVMVNGKEILTSTEILDLSIIPKDLIIIGGGVIGVEFACIFSSLGSKVKIIEMLPEIISTEDHEIIRGLTGLFKKRNIEIYTDTKVKEAKINNGHTEVLAIDKEGKEMIFSAEKILMAVGRTPFTEGLGLEKIDIEMNGKFVKVNEKMETSIPNIYAVGDVTGHQMLAHKAMAEGIAAVENASGHYSKIDYSKIPNCIYTFPEISSIGISERKAKERGINFVVGRFPFQSNGKALASGESEGFVKVIAEKELGEVIGVHILGENATDLIGGPTLALALEATVSELGKTIQPHPTLIEAIAEAALDAIKEAIHLPRKR